MRRLLGSIAAALATLTAAALSVVAAAPAWAGEGVNPSPAGTGRPLFLLLSGGGLFFAITGAVLGVIALVLILVRGGRNRPPHEDRRDY